MYRFTTTIILFIATAGHSQQNYPNIDGETLLEDEIHEPIKIPAKRPPKEVPSPRPRLW